MRERRLLSREHLVRLREAFLLEERSEAEMAEVNERLLEVTRRVLSELVAGDLGDPEILKRFGEGWLANLGETDAETLRSLQGLLVSGLTLEGPSISDLTPLRGLPLTQLVLKDTAVTDLSPLVGMAIEELHLHATLVTDLRPLSSLPLTHLCLGGSDRVCEADLAPLAKISSLERLLLARGIRNLEALRNHPGLESLSFRTIGQPIASFWAWEAIKREDYEEAIRLLHIGLPNSEVKYIEWGTLGILLAAHGSRTEFEGFCRESAHIANTQAGKFRANFVVDLATIALLHPAPGLSEEEIENLFHDPSFSTIPLHDVLRPLFHYRFGRPTQALRGWNPASYDNPRDSCILLAAHALILHGASQSERARELVSQARAGFDTWMPPSAFETASHYHNILLPRILLEEAERTVAAEPGGSSSNPIELPASGGASALAPD